MMSTLTKTTRTTKKLEAPRPLRSASSQITQNRNSVSEFKVSSVDDLLVLTQTVAYAISTQSYDNYFQSNFDIMYDNLKKHGAQLETSNKDLLDRYYVLFRNGSQDDNLDRALRLRLLELIELRAKMWRPSDTMSHYYQHRVTHCEPLLTAAADIIPIESSPPHVISNNIISPVIESQQPLLLSPGEIIKTSGKFIKPTKIPGKNYSKDEVVIRNADSGKVMGIKGRRVHMIEELSDTIISFQRVSPGAKERLVQITGPNEENVNHAKHLIGDTIKRNASPVRLEGNPMNVRDSTSSLNSSASEDSGRPALFSQQHVSRALLHSLSTNDVPLGEFRYTVNIGSGHCIKLIGNNLTILNEAKVLLDEHFEHFNEAEFASGEMGDFFRLGPKASPEKLINGLSDDVFLENSIDVNNYPKRLLRAVSLIEPRDENKNVELPLMRALSLSDAHENERKVGKLSYSMDMILHYASSPLSNVHPHGVIPPSISRKSSRQFDGEQFFRQISGVSTSEADEVADESQAAVDPE